MILDSLYTFLCSRIRIIMFYSTVLLRLMLPDCVRHRMVSLVRDFVHKTFNVGLVGMRNLCFLASFSKKEKHDQTSFLLGTIQIFDI